MPINIRRRLLSVKEACRFGSGSQHVLRRRSLCLTNIPYLIVLGRARIERPTEKQFGHDTSQAPNIDRLAKWQAKKNLRRTIVPRLQICRLYGLRDVRGRAKVDDFNLVGLSNRVDKHNVLGLEIGVNETELLELTQREQHLLHDRPNALERQRRELVLLEKVVQVLLEHLEHETRVVLVLKDLVGAHQVVLVGVLLAQPRQDAHLDLALTRIARVVLKDLYGDNLVRALVPAFHHLTECAATEELEHLVAVGHRVKDLVKHELVVTFVVAIVVVCGCSRRRCVVVGRRSRVIIRVRHHLVEIIRGVALLDASVIRLVVVAT